jgi:hypothetical protein
MRSPRKAGGPWLRLVVGRGLPSCRSLFLGGDALRMPACGGGRAQGLDCLRSFSSRVLIVKRLTFSMIRVSPRARLQRLLLYPVPALFQYEHLSFSSKTKLEVTRCLMIKILLSCGLSTGAQLCSVHGQVSTACGESRPVSGGVSTRLKIRLGIFLFNMDVNVIFMLVLHHIRCPYNVR